uniref:RNase H family protein n=1 Tax=Solanum tuberosum TaxID=4113 RepID=M1CYY3_SOLTU
MSPPTNTTPVTSSSTVGNGDNDHQIWIVPEEDGFDPHKIVIEGIASCIRSKFEFARPSWKKFPESTHDMWFEEFKIEMASSTAATSNTSKKRARKSTPSSRRVDPNAKSMNLKKCPLFADWEEIFSKDRATGEFAEEAQEITNGTSVGFPIVVVEVNDASGTREDQAAQEEPNVSTGATQSPFTAQVEPNESTGAAQSSFTTQKGKTHQSQKQGNNFKATSSKVNEKGTCKKRKTVEDDNETVLKGLMEVMKQFTESHDKRMTSLINKLGEHDIYEIHGNIFSIIGFPTFEIYNLDERVKVAMEITQDIKRM